MQSKQRAASVRTERRFWALVEHHKAHPAAGATYTRGKDRVPIICAEGHSVSVVPEVALRTGSVCKTCANRDSQASAADFWDRVAQVGAKGAPGAMYRRRDVPVNLICARGHRWPVLPKVVQAGGGCRTCSDNDQAGSEAQFWQLVKDYGAIAAPGALYINNRCFVTLVCREGHEFDAAPKAFRRGEHRCERCQGRPKRRGWQDSAAPRTMQAGKSPQQAEKRFHARLLELGAELLAGSRYRGSTAEVVVRCAQGHRCVTTPNKLQRGYGPCRVCSGNNAAVAEAEFWTRVAEHGATPRPGSRYTGADNPVLLKCSQGHDCAPRPSQLQQGGGPCGACTVSYDRLYLLIHPEAGALKAGIASGEARVRGHARRGYLPLAVWEDLDYRRARDAEREVLGFWRDRGWAIVAAAPADGVTETTATEHLTATLRYLSLQLGAPTRRFPENDRCSTARSDVLAPAR